MRHTGTFPHDKATVPVLPPNFVPRKEVRRRLEQLVADAPVTLVCAPAGYGKTLLLADWAETTGESDKIWLSLDDADDDPERFWTVLADAIHAHAVTAGIDDTGLLPGEPDAVDRLAAVVDAIARLPAPCHLVLDDLHEVAGEETLRGIAGLVAYQPDNLRIVLSCRGMPPLPLARMRLASRLAVLGPSDLAFSHEDATALLRAAGTTLTSAQVRLLIEETDGWAAGLRLAARALHPGHDGTGHDAFLARCATTDRVTEDYLDGEVLTGLPAATVDLLRAVSTCDEVTPALAVALSGQDDAAATLAALERETSLVTGVGAGRRRFRPHPLLRSCLRTVLTRRYPDRVSALHTVAAGWFAANEEPAMAFDHAVRSGDPSAAAELLRDHAVPTLMRGDHRSVRRALDAAGDEAVARDPLLSLVSALTHVQAGDPDAALADLARTRDAWPAEPGERLPALHRLVTATHALLHGASDGAEPVDWHALVRAEDGGDLEPWARLGHGWSLLLAGSRPAARHELERAERLARERGLDYLVVHSRAALGALSGVDGAVAAAEEACSDALAIAEANGWHGGFAVELAHLMTGLARVLRADPAGALAAVSRPDPVSANLRYLSDVVEGTAHFDIGNRVTGLRLLRRARARLGDLGAPVQMPVGGAQLEHRCALELGLHAHAQEVLAWTTGIAGDRAEVVLMQAWTAFAGDDVAAAETAVREVLAESRPALWRPVTLVEARLLEAALELRQGRRMRACTALTTALSLAEPAALVRPFRHADPSVLGLLHEHIGGFGGADDFAAMAGRRLSTVDAPTSALLTKREQAVLVLLSSRHSLTELAAELTMSVNTVKTHIRSIYTKLDVNSRRAAVVAGRRLGLM
jgi:LuxR family maltose regulon positive regulatory protein